MREKIGREERGRGKEKKEKERMRKGEKEKDLPGVSSNRGKEGRREHKRVVWMWM